MTRGVSQPEKQEEALRLRLEQRLSLREIGNVIGVPIGTLSGWLAKHPLTADEKKGKLRRKQLGVRKKYRGEKAKFWGWADLSSISRKECATIAEAAVLFRLALGRFHLFGPVFDGERTDWLVGKTGSRRLAHIQVKSVKSHGHGLPIVPLRCTEGHNRARRYHPGEFDFIVGYDNLTDIAYVFSEEDTAFHKTGIVISQNAAEAWQKVHEFIMRA